MTQQKILANFNCCLITVNNNLHFSNRNQLKNRVLQLQVNFLSQIGKYLMAKALQRERRKLRFLYDVAVVECASCFLHKACLRKQC